MARAHMVVSRRGLFLLPLLEEQAQRRKATEARGWEGRLSTGTALRRPVSAHGPSRSRSKKVTRARAQMVAGGSRGRKRSSSLRERTSRPLRKAEAALLGPPERALLVPGPALNVMLQEASRRIL